MKRMYGDQRHISVLRAEIESNDVEYLSEWKVREDVRRRYSTSTSESTTPPVEHVTSPYFRPASTTGTTAKITTASKPHHMKSGYTQHPKPITPNTDSYNSTTSGSTTHTTSANRTSVPQSVAAETNIEPTTANLPTNPNSDVTSDNILSTLEDIMQKHLVSTTPCPSTEQAETSTMEPPTATTMEFMNEESTTATTTAGSTVTTTGTTQKDKVFESQLFQDAKEQVTDSNSQSTSSGVLKIRGVNACPVKEEVVAPFWANNTRGEILALLNLYPFEQYVHWEKCTFEHKQMFCREGCRCEQQYRLHRLLAYDPNNECRGIFSDWFKFPSCCVCRCYDLPLEFQITSRSPRTQLPTWNLYNRAPPDWYRMANAG
ncbi:protein spaetzle 4 isoform X2 [Periplaneta americana]